MRGPYARWILPRLTDLAMRSAVVRAERARRVPAARGEVLEVGVGSGLNLAFYGAGVRQLHALDASPELLAMARRRASGLAFPVDFLEGSAEAIPLAASTVDWVVTTWTLCTIPQPGRALDEMRRVLRADGRLLFIEHGRSPDPGVSRWQDRLTPLWRRVTGGCHLNRPIDRLLSRAGFEVIELEQSYVAGPRVGGYFYRGVARSVAPTPGSGRRAGESRAREASHGT